MDTLAVMRRAAGLDKSKTEEQEDLYLLSEKT